jgi:hypothetical protein
VFVTSQGELFCFLLISGCVRCYQPSGHKFFHRATIFKSLAAMILLQRCQHDNRRASLQDCQWDVPRFLYYEIMNDVLYKSFLTHLRLKPNSDYISVDTYYTNASKNRAASIFRVTKLHLCRSSTFSRNVETNLLTYHV